MAIAFDTIGNGWGTTGTTHTFSHTCTGSDRILFVSLLVLNTSDIVIGVTYGGVSMTRVGILNLTGTENDYLYYIVGPTSGANNVVTTTSSSTTIYANSSSYTGADQISQPDAINTGVSGLVTSFSTSVTTIVDNCWMVGYMRSTSNQTPISGTTFRSGVNSTEQIVDSNGPLSPVGTYSLGVNGVSALYNQIVASFKPVQPIISSNSNFLLFF